MPLKNVFYRNDLPAADHLPHRLKRQRNILRTIMGMTAFTFFYYTYEALLKGLPSAAAIPALIATMLACGLAASFLVTKPASAHLLYNWLSSAYLVLIIFQHIYLFFSLGRLEYTPWAILTPLVCFLLRGLKSGAIYAFTYTGVVCAGLLRNPFGNAESQIYFQVVLGTVGCTIIAFFYELVRTRIEDKLVERGEKLKAAEQALLEKNAALDRTVDELKTSRKKLETINVGLEKEIELRVGEVLKKNEQLEANNLELEKAQEQLRESEKRYRQLFTNAPMMILDIDVEKKAFIEFNEAICEVLGYGRQELMEIDPRSLIAESDRSRFDEWLANILSGKLASTLFTFPVKTKNRQNCWVMGNCLVFHRAGRPSRILAMAHDITNHKNLQNQLLRSQKREAVSTLAGGIAHNFNNMLTAIMGNTALMRTETEDLKRLRERIDTIERYVMDGSRLTSQLLTFARGSRYEIRPVTLNKLVRDLCEMFHRAQKWIQLDFRLADDLRGIEADRNQIEQALMNILINAAHAMPHGGAIAVETKNVDVAPGTGTDRPDRSGAYAAVTITDTGIGMDEETVQRIFDPFFTTRENEGGTGLGMASVWGIIDSHNGFINVDSKPGKGTSVTIYLPASAAVKIKPPEMMEEEWIPGSGTILVVDDEERVLQAGRQILGKLGYEVVAASGGKEAVEWFAAHQGAVDLVILDLVMPSMNGRQTFDRLREINPDVTVLVVSGFDKQGEVEEMLAKGCKDYLQKPYTVPMLSRKIRDLIGQPGRR